MINEARENQEPTQIKLARILGRKTAEAEFHFKRLLPKIEQVLFQVGVTIDPLATNSFTLSNHFSRSTKPVVETAVRKSNLPEGICVTPKADEYVNQQHVVVSMSGFSFSFSQKAYDNHAMKIVDYSVDTDAFAKSLSS